MTTNESTIFLCLLFFLSPHMHLSYVFAQGTLLEFNLTELRLQWVRLKACEAGAPGQARALARRTHTRNGLSLIVETPIVLLVSPYASVQLCPNARACPQHASPRPYAMVTRPRALHLHREAPFTFTARCPSPRGGSRGRGREGRGAYQGGHRAAAAPRAAPTTAAAAPTACCHRACTAARATPRARAPSR